ncbi:MAG TPA: hypothetical protein VET90_09355, partial [Candidatus Binatus sp.]|nr:hypothetical protein [Candidatus Binatus sp.]
MSTTQALAPVRAGNDPGPTPGPTTEALAWRYPPIEALLGGAILPRARSVGTRRRRGPLRVI